MVQNETLDMNRRNVDLRVDNQKLEVGNNIILLYSTQYYCVENNKTKPLQNFLSFIRGRSLISYNYSMKRDFNANRRCGGLPY